MITKEEVEHLKNSDFCINDYQPCIRIGWTYNDIGKV